MKNFGTLYRYELKKIAKRKLTWLVPLALAALLVSMAIAGSASKGRDRQPFLRDGAAQMDGQVMDEAFFSTMRKTLSEADITGNPLDGASFYAVNPEYYEPYFMVLELGIDPKAATAEDFYSARQARLEEKWAAQDLTEREIAYWSAQEALVQKPFTFQSTQDGLSDCLAVVYGISTILPVAIAVCLCEVFSQERRARTEPMIFSSKQGKRTLCFVKLLAGVTAALCAAIFVIGPVCAAYALLKGWNSLGAAIQLKYLDSSLPITLGQALFLLLGLLLFYGLLCGGVAMLVSVWTGNTVAALAAPIVLMIAQAWIRLPSLPAADYLPNQLFNHGYVFCNVRLVGFFGAFFNNIAFAFLLYGTITVLLFVLCVLGWRRNAVSGK